MNHYLTRGVSSLFSVGLALVLALPLGAQQGPGQQTTTRGFGLESFYIRGQVLDDATGEAVEGCRVMLTAFGGGYLQQVYVDSMGDFLFGDLTRGTYYIIASRPGYREQRERVEIVNASRPGVIIHLRPKPPKKTPVWIEPLDVDEQLVPKEARQELKKAVEAARERKWKESLAHFDKALEIHPEYVSALHNKALVQLRLRDIEGAQKNTEKAIALNPNVAAPRVVLGSILNARQLYSRAQEQLERAIQLNPQTWLGHFELSRAYWAQRDLPGAEKAIIRAHELNPNVPNVHLMRANIFLARQDFEGALGELDEFLALVPKDPRADTVRQRRADLAQRMASTAQP
ncbi:MAG: tetratricopeptide repeat protein [Terriglobia bacterium]